MLKQGKFRAIRNMPVGWVLQAIHSTDRSERYFRVAIEIITFFIIYFIISRLQLDVKSYYEIIIALIINHTLTWFITGNFWVYMLDSFLWVRNPGIAGVLRFINLSKSLFVKSNSVDAILIYGSMCRGQLHIRSDLDLRILRSPGLYNALISLSIGFLIRAYSFFIRMPVDLEVVDSMAFIRQQMREDERPINVYIRDNVEIPEAGIDFKEVELKPSLVLRDAH